MDEVEDETIGTWVPVLFRVGNTFEGCHGSEQFLSQGTRDKLVGLPDALSWADLNSYMVSVQQP